MQKTNGEATTDEGRKKSELKNVTEIKKATGGGVVGATGGGGLRTEEERGLWALRAFSAPHSNLSITSYTSWTINTIFPPFKLAHISNQLDHFLTLSSYLQSEQFSSVCIHPTHPVKLISSSNIFVQ